MDKVIILMFIVLLLVPLVSSVGPPQTSANTVGIEVRSAVDEVIKVGEDYKFHFHAFNATSGVHITTANCSFHLYNQSGSHIVKLWDNVTDNDFDYEFLVTKGNFTSAGEYSYICQCNTTTVGGFIASSVLVNYQGKSYSSTDGLIYISLFFTLIGLFVFLVYSTIKIDWNNYKDDENNIIRVNWYKYLRIFSFAMAYTTFVAIAYFSWSISYGILQFTELSNFFMVIYRISFIAIFPLFILLAIFTLVKFLKDLDLNKYLERGLEVNG